MTRQHRRLRPLPPTPHFHQSFSNPNPNPSSVAIVVAIGISSSSTERPCNEAFPPHLSPDSVIPSSIHPPPCKHPLRGKKMAKFPSPSPQTLTLTLTLVPWPCPLPRRRNLPKKPSSSSSSSSCRMKLFSVSSSVHLCFPSSSVETMAKFLSLPPQALTLTLAPQPYILPRRRNLPKKPSACLEESVSTPSSAPFCLASSSMETTAKFLSPFPRTLTLTPALSPWPHRFPRRRNLANETISLPSSIPVCLASTSEESMASEEETMASKAERTAFEEETMASNLKADRMAFEEETMVTKEGRRGEFPSPPSPSSLPNGLGRRLAIGVGSGLAVAIGGNLGGITSFLLSFNPSVAESLKLDTVYPVNGFKRCVEMNFEFLYPATWVGDQRLLYRAAERAERERLLDLPSLEKAKKRGSNATDPVVAFGPPGSNGELNVSVIAAQVAPDFSLEKIGGPIEAGSLILDKFIASRSRGIVPTLLSAKRRVGNLTDEKIVYYTLEFKVKGPSFLRHNLAVYVVHKGLLFSLNAQSPETMWSDIKEQLQKATDSFMVTM